MVGDAKSIFEGGLAAFHGQWIPTLEARFKGQSTKATDRLLEHHTRAFVLDKLLYALGWSQQANGGGHQNLLTEAFYDSAKPQEATLYLDYLGRDVANDLPLLVFESKRFKAVTPAQLIEVGAARRPKRRFASAAAALVDAFKDASWVKGEWAEHVKQLREYFNAVKKAHGYPPSVMAIGNGDWLVILRDPARAFAGTASATDFLVIAPDAQDKIGDAYVRQFKEIYDLLAFERLSRVAKGVPPELIPTGIRTATEVMIMRGVRVGYSKFPKLNAALHPRFEIEPVAFVRTPTSPWVLVELNADTHELPHVHAQLPDHLNAVHDHSEQLLARIAQRLAVAPTPLTITQHYADSHSFMTRTGTTAEGIVKPEMLGYLLVTGTESHFIRAEPRIVNCPRHSWTSCHPVNDGRHPDKPLAHPSVSMPKAFFPDGRVHHCAAGVTFGAKRMPIDKNLPADFGMRSGNDGEPFCEIFDFEQMLCCQTCVFLEVCSASRLFKLPCLAAQVPAPVAALASAAPAPAP